MIKNKFIMKKRNTTRKNFKTMKPLLKIEVQVGNRCIPDLIIEMRGDEINCYHNFSWEDEELQEFLHQIIPPLIKEVYL